MQIVGNLKNRETYTEGNKHLHSYYEIPLLKDFCMIKSRSFRIISEFEFGLYLLALGSILDFLMYSTNMYWEPYCVPGILLGAGDTVLQMIDIPILAYFPHLLIGGNTSQSCLEVSKMINSA